MINGYKELTLVQLLISQLVMMGQYGLPALSKIETRESIWCITISPIRSLWRWMDSDNKYKWPGMESH